MAIAKKVDYSRSRTRLLSGPRFPRGDLGALLEVGGVGFSGHDFRLLRCVAPQLQSGKYESYSILAGLLSYRAAELAWLA